MRYAMTLIHLPSEEVIDRFQFKRTAAELSHSGRNEGEHELLAMVIESCHSIVESNLDPMQFEILSFSGIGRQDMKIAKINGDTIALLGKAACEFELSKGDKE